jgi:hypothetical protein
MIADTGEVFDAAAADQDNRVLLEVVTFSRNVRSYFNLVR